MASLRDMVKQRRAGGSGSKGSALGTGDPSNLNNRVQQWRDAGGLVHGGSGSRGSALGAGHPSNLSNLIEGGRTGGGLPRGGSGFRGSALGAGHPSNLNELMADQRGAPQQPQVPQLGDDVLPESEFMQQFQQSLANSRRRIQEQLQMAVAEVARREQQGQELVGTMPGSINDAFGAAQGNLADQVVGARGAANELGLNPLGDPLTGVAPVAGAMELDQAARLSDVPFLEAGLNDLMARQRGALDVAALNAGGQLDQEQRGLFLNRLAAEDQARQARRQREATLQQLLLGEQLTGQRQSSLAEQEFEQRQRLAEQEFGQSQQLAEQDFGQQVDLLGLRGEIEAPTGAPQEFGSRDVDPARGQMLMQEQPELVEKIRSREHYPSLLDLFQEAITGGAPPEQAAMLVQLEAQRANKPRTASVLLADLGL